MYLISIIQSRGPPVGHGPHVEKPWYRTLDLKSNPVDSSHFDNYFKRTISCPVTRLNMNVPSKQRPNWRYHCSATYVTQRWRNHLIYCYV